jgi:hypothetical protein
MAPSTRTPLIWRPCFAAVVVQQAHHAPIRAARQFPQQVGGGITGANHQNGLLPGVHAAIQLCSFHAR